MKNYKSCLVFAFFCLGLLGGGAFVAAENETEDETLNLIKDETKELNQLKSKITKQDSEIKSIGKEETSVLKTLSFLENKLNAKERELNIYQWNAQVSKKKLMKMNENIQLTQSDLEKHKAILGNRFRAIYKEGNMFAIKALFSAEDVNDLLKRIKYMEMVLEYDSKIFFGYRQTLEKLNAQKQESLEAQNKIASLENNAKKKQDELLKEKLDKSNFLKKIENKKALTLQARKELINSSDQVRDIIAKLQEKMILGRGLDFADKAGRLELPVKGKIISTFGRKKDIKYNSYIVSNGITIQARKGTIIRSIFAGKVLYTGSLEGYGNIVIVGHGNGYHSLYGHLDKIHVKVGSLVDAGHAIGNSGDTGSLLGEVLYLEIRHNGKPVDPAKWFRMAKK